MNHDELRAKLKEWFANSYRRDQFRSSMGEIETHTQAMLAVTHFLAQGVALLGYYDHRYLQQIFETHDKLFKMAKDIEEKVPDGRSDITYQFATIAGTIIELAGKALTDVVKE